MPAVDAQSLVDELARVVVGAEGAHRDVTLARQAVFAEAAALPSVRDEIEHAQDDFAEWITPTLLQSGCTDVDGHHRMLLALVDGLITRRLLAPAEQLDPAIAIEALMRGLLDHSQRPAHAIVGAEP